MESETPYLPPGLRDLDLTQLTPLKRTSNNLCLYGPPGTGKTLETTHEGFWRYIEGDGVFANYPLLFPNDPDEGFYQATYFDKLPKLNEDLDDCESKRKLIIGDDFERYASSKFKYNLEKKDLVDIILDWGKQNIDFIWTCKRPLEVDKSIRGPTLNYARISKYLKVMPKTIQEYEFYKEYLDFYYLEIMLMDLETGLPLEIKNLDNLPLWAKWYDTTWKVSGFKK